MLPAERRADQSIADILEACRVRLARGETVEQCLSAYPSDRDELASLLPIVVEAQDLARDPNPHYAAGARRRFRAALAAARENRAREVRAQDPGPFGWLQRLAVPLVFVCILSLSGLGLVQAAEPSLPDSPLYTVKQAGENVGQVFARTPQERGQLQLKLANRRWLDLDRAISQRKAPQVLLTIATAMVDASDLATDYVLQTEGPARQPLAVQIRALLPKERTALNILVISPRIAVSQAGRGLQQELLVDEQKLASQ